MTAQYYQPVPSYSSENFDISYKTGDFTTQAIMQMKRPIVMTSKLPHTHTFLQTNFPQVLTTRCFNDSNLPFCEEVKNTEIAHLFEHILLQYLYQEKSARGFSQITFNGRTYWDWEKNPYGSFKIIIDAGRLDLPWLATASQKATQLLESLLLPTNHDFTVAAH